MDHSDIVASDVLIRTDASSGPGTTLSFRPRSRWAGALVFGSWGVVIVVPMTLFAVSGEIPSSAIATAGAIYAIGLALSYAAVRRLVNGARLELEGSELCFRRGPLWPWRAQRWPAHAIAGTRIELRPVSFRHPARYRGYPVPRPYLVRVSFRDGTQTALPITLGARDADDVAAWIERARGA